MMSMRVHQISLKVFGLLMSVLPDPSISENESEVDDPAASVSCGASDSSQCSSAGEIRVYHWSVILEDSKLLEWVSSEMISIVFSPLSLIVIH